MARRYWLMKSEPSCFSLEDLRGAPGGTEHWDGVRNYQARNFMRQMKAGDLALFYHSNCAEPGVVGIMRITRESYPDHTAWDRDGEHFDAKSTPENPRWFMVDVTFVEALQRAVPLAQMRAVPALGGMQLLKVGNRLSVMPLTKEEFEEIIKLSRE